MKSQIDSKILLQKEVNLSKLEEFAKELISYLPKNGIVLLNGNLATGKTTLVANIVKALNIDSTLATSPTFSLQQIYGDKIFHYDFYRIEFEEIINLGLLEEFEKEGLHFIEWASKELTSLLIQAGFNTYSITIKTTDKNSREYKLEVLNA